MLHAYHSLLHHGVQSPLQGLQLRDSAGLCASNVCSVICNMWPVAASMKNNGYIGKHLSCAASGNKKEKEMGLKLCSRQAATASREFMHCMQDMQGMQTQREGSVFMHDSVRLSTM